MRAKTDADLIRLSKKMTQLAEQMRDIYYACRDSENPHLRAAAAVWDYNDFDLWCGFDNIAEDAIAGKYEDPGLPQDDSDEEILNNLREGLDDVRFGWTRPLDELLSEIDSE